MIWPFVILLTALVLGAILLLFPATRSGWQALAAALLLGLAGYTFQGSPSAPSATKAREETVADHPEAQVAARQKLAGSDDQNQRWLMMANAMIRHGQYADAATTLRIAVEENPKNGEAWLAMANALVGHSQGMLSPAALYAYRQASQADPQAPGPPFFLGLALAQSGRLTEGRALWAMLLARAPADAPWRGDLQKRLAMLDAFIARQEMMAAGQGGPMPPPPAGPR
ncbi:MAG: tetratricopeptide repeat protein [Sphingomonadales bacterium]|nr:tetratricopeptide repeat protein [Sphingomonadales bacterium]